MPSFRESRRTALATLLAAYRAFESPPPEFRGDIGMNRLRNAVKRTSAFAGNAIRDEAAAAPDAVTFNLLLILASESDILHNFLTELRVSRGSAAGGDLTRIAPLASSISKLSTQFYSCLDKAIQNRQFGTM
jgi:hypothetical protein